MPRNTAFRPEQVDGEAWIAPGAVVLGDVTIAAESSIWFNAVIRGDTTSVEIGPRTNIQDGCVLHADPGYPCKLGEGVTVGHMAIVHGATVERNVVIGMRAVVMNGAIIGENSIVGVGAVVTAGTHIPPGSLVLGMPAKVRRTLNDEEIQGNARTAQHYVEAAKEFSGKAETPPQADDTSTEH